MIISPDGSCASGKHFKVWIDSSSVLSGSTTSSTSSSSSSTSSSSSSSSSSSEMSSSTGSSRRFSSVSITVDVVDEVYKKEN